MLPLLLADEGACVLPNGDGSWSVSYGDGVDPAGYLSALPDGAVMVLCESTELGWCERWEM